MRILVSCVGKIVRAVLGPVRTAGLHLVRLASPRTVTHGIELVDMSGSDVTPLFFERATEALNLIAEHAPNWLKRVSRGLRRIVLIKAGGEFYHLGLKAYVAEVATLRRRSPGEVALAIAHEATHARLERLGFGYAAGLRDRIERICIDSELDLASRLPDSATLSAAVVMKLAKPWWHEEQLQERRLTQLRAHGVPRWIVRIYARLLS